MVGATRFMLVAMIVGAVLVVSFLYPSYIRFGPEQVLCPSVASSSSPGLAQRLLEDGVVRAEYAIRVYRTGAESILGKVDQARAALEAPPSQQVSSEASLRAREAAVAADMARARFLMGSAAALTLLVGLIGIPSIVLAVKVVRDGRRNGSAQEDGLGGGPQSGGTVAASRARSRVSTPSPFALPTSVSSDRDTAW